MNSKTMWATLIAVFAALALHATQFQQHTRFKLIDLGTFGGPQSFYFSEPVVQSVNNPGIAAGGGETAAADPFAPNCQDPDCLILHAFQWRNGHLTDLGTLPGGQNSTAYWISNGGLVVGDSQNGQTDPITGSPKSIVVLWDRGQISSLGTLGGNFSFPNAVNNHGQVVGIAQNALSDQFSLIGVGTQTRAFLWQNGVMLDLGTLGGPDAWAASINDNGEIAGWALVDSTANESTGQPTQHPFLWRRGRLIDLGTLGGTSAVVGALQSPGAGASINNRGQIIGTSNLAGDLIHHPFLWDRGELKDLGTLGGNNGEAWWINDAGVVVGRADLSGSQVHHAALWKDGNVTDLGASPTWPCSTAIDINSQGQVIINTGLCGLGGGPGLFWEKGQAYDLNDLIPANSGIRIGDVNFINDRGEIAATGILSNGDQHAVLLIPCDGSDSDCEFASADSDAQAHGDSVAGQAEPQKRQRLSKIASRYGSLLANRRNGIAAPATR